MGSSQAVADQQAPPPTKRRGRPPKAASEAAMNGSADGSETRRRRSAPMGDAHKAALAEGREAGRAIRQYLEALESHRPKRGRRRTRESIEKRLAAIEESIGAVDSLTRLHLVQERMDLREQLLTVDREPDLSQYEAAFIAHAGGYSQRKGISYGAWREFGVPGHVLRAAGIAR